MTKYSVASAAATATADGTQVDTAQGIGITIKDALDKGHKVTMTKYGTAANTASVNWEVVKELGDDEIAATVWNNAATDTVNELLTAAVAGGSTPLGTAAALTADNLRATSLGGTDTTYTTPISADDFAKSQRYLHSVHSSVQFRTD